MKKRLISLLALLLCLVWAAGCVQSIPTFGDNDVSSALPLLPTLLTASPTVFVTAAPSTEPVPTATIKPTPAPTPTFSPTPEPTAVPSPTPSPVSTPVPTPTSTPKPTVSPTAKPTAVPVPNGQKIVPLTDAAYGYEAMNRDISLLLQEFPQVLHKTVIGQSEFGRDIPALILGDPGNENRVLLVATTHAREYANTLIVMSILERYLRHMDELSYGGQTIRELINACALWIVPMHNPDGVEICLHGLDAVPEAYKATVETIYARSVAAGFLNKGSYALWKANGLGYDLNEAYGYDGGSGTYQSQPMSQGYPGEGTADAKEAAAIVKLIGTYSFKSLACYHSTGSLVYWGYRATGAFRTHCQTMVKTITSLTGYTSRTDGNGYRYMGLKDWFMKAYQKPGFTIETGRAAAPLPLEDILKAIDKNLYVPAFLLSD